MWKPVRFKNTTGMSAHEEEATGEAKTGEFEDNEENSMKFSSDLLDESIKASLEPSHAQISAFTEMMDRLIQSHSANEPTTEKSEETRHRHESPYSGVPESLSFRRVALLTTAEHPPHMATGANRTSHRRPLTP